MNIPDVKPVTLSPLANRSQQQWQQNRRKEVPDQAGRKRPLDQSADERKPGEDVGLHIDVEA